MPGRFQLRFPCGWTILLYLSSTALGLWVSLAAPASPFPPTARSERYRHLGSEDDETNDEESSTEIPQFSSCSHRFSKVSRPAGDMPKSVYLCVLFSPVF